MASSAQSITETVVEGAIVRTALALMDAGGYEQAHYELQAMVAQSDRRKGH